MSRRYSGAVAGLFAAMMGCEMGEEASRIGSATLPDKPFIQADITGAKPTEGDSSQHARGSVRERMVEDDLSWMKAHPNDHLASVVDVSGKGERLHLTGAIAAFEGQSMIALVNVSRADQPLVLQKWFEAGGGTGVGKLDVTVDIPKDVKAGDCLAVKNTSGGRGFTDDEVRVKEEFGAFLYVFTDGAPKVFRTAEQCLADAAANRVTTE